MAEDSDLEKTEPASPRKLDQARERGQVPRSRELSTFAVFLASGGVVALLGIFIFDALQKVMLKGLAFGRAEIADPARMLEVFAEAGWIGLWAILPVAAGVVFAAVGANLLVSGWLFTAKAFELDLNRLNPVSGIGRMFSWRSLVELGKTLLKALVIAGAAFWMIWAQRDGLLNLPAESFETAIVHFGQITLFTFLAAAAAFALIALIDVPYQIWDYHHGLRMTKEEVRQEQKEMEGDPQIKARIRSLQREAARRRMMAAVPKADVVVTNPLHYAVALKYEEKKMNAPKVVAKGSQLVAERIKEIARENRVPVVEAPPLARALHRHAEVGETIPGPLFSAVAQVLAYVYQLNQHLNPMPPAEWQVPANLDPGVREAS
ncbi:MAG TPA: flagellar biosynthesis protein FlhB [Thiobacillaceae bacterium]|nr:flagellar biosynthesis protein FlhB [Thiobacillaceae bacterium]